MADICTCGHEEREHSDEVANGRRDFDSDERDDCWHPCDVGHRDGDERTPCRCRFYARSPRSAFRGPMRWTPRDAADALLALSAGARALGAIVADDMIAAADCVLAYADGYPEIERYPWWAGNAVRSFVIEARRQVDAAEDPTRLRYALQRAGTYLTAARILRGVRP